MECLPFPLSVEIPAGLEMQSEGVRKRGCLESIASVAAASSSARSAKVEEQVAAEICHPSSRLGALFPVPVEGVLVQTLPVFPVELLLPVTGATAPVGPPPRIRDRSSWERSELRWDTCPPSKPDRAVVLVGS